MNTKAFFDTVREALFGGKLSQEQVDGLNAILAECNASGICDDRFTAYILATAYHEVGKNMQPVREGFANSDSSARRHVTGMYNRGQISTNYALPESNGQSYYGRGFVQLTWSHNYKKAGDKLGIDLYNNPDLALHNTIAAKILVRGMLEGWFTGKKLSDYFTDNKTDWKNARRTVNGLDKAEKIAGDAKAFYDALNK